MHHQTYQVYRRAETVAKELFPDIAVYKIKEEVEDDILQGVTLPQVTCKLGKPHMRFTRKGIPPALEIRVDHCNPFFCLMTILFSPCSSVLFCLFAGQVVSVVAVVSVPLG